MSLVIILLGLSAAAFPGTRARISRKANSDGANSRWLKAVITFKAMTYSPPDNISQFQPADPWNNTLEYAPTPGNFGRTSTSSCSPEYVPDDHHPTHDQPQAEQLVFLPFADWEEERVYNEQPPIYIHYRIDWKVTLNGKNIAQVTEPDLVVRPSDFWQHSLKDAAEKSKNRKVDHTRRVRLDDISVVASVRDRTQQDLHQQFERTNTWDSNTKKVKRDHIPDPRDGIKRKSCYRQSMIC